MAGHRRPHAEGVAQVSLPLVDGQQLLHFVSARGCEDVPRSEPGSSDEYPHGVEPSSAVGSSRSRYRDDLYRVDASLSVDRRDDRGGQRGCERACRIHSSVAFECDYHGSRDAVVFES
ncbi:hypothetical protein BH09ACT4_BH09ACT4_13910 [soil metagenome]